MTVCSRNGMKKGVPRERAPDDRAVYSSTTSSPHFTAPEATTVA